MIPLLFLESSLLFTLSKALKVDIKKVIKHKITTPVNSNMSKFFIYFFSFKLKNINNTTIVGGHNPMKIAFSKLSSTR